MAFVFDLVAFVSDPTLEVLNACRKVDLMEIAHLLE